MSVFEFESNIRNGTNDVQSAVINYLSQLPIWAARFCLEAVLFSYVHRHNSAISPGNQKAYLFERHLALIVQSQDDGQRLNWKENLMFQLRLDWFSVVRVVADILGMAHLGATLALSICEVAFNRSVEVVLAASNAQSFGFELFDRWNFPVFFGHVESQNMLVFLYFFKRVHFSVVIR